MTDALIRSLLITTVGTALSLVVTVAMAYGLTRRDLVGGRFFLMTALFTMLFSPGIIPSFLMVKELGLLDSYAALVLPTLMSAFNLVVVRSFFMNLPQELFEAAKIDGAGTSASWSRWCCRSREACWPSSDCSTRWATGTRSSTPCST